MQIESSITIRDLLWEWSRAYPERPGDCVDWYRRSSFAEEMVADQYPEAPPPPIDYRQAERTNEAVRLYLSALRARQNRAKSIFEEGIFWLRYHQRWDLPDVARRQGKSERWIKNKCETIEACIEMAFNILPDDLTGTCQADTFVQAAVFTQ